MIDSLFDEAIHPINFKAIFELMPGMSVLLQTDAPYYTILALTKGMLQVQPSGISREALEGKPFFQSFPSYAGEQDFIGEKNMRKSFEYVMLHKKIHDIPCQRYSLPNGDGTFSEHYRRVNNIPYLNSQGEVVYIIHTSEDITEQVKLQKSEERMKGMKQAYDFFMEAATGICIINGNDMAVELANDAYLQIVGRTRKDFVGKPLWESLPELKSQGVDDLLRKVRATGIADRSSEHVMKLWRDNAEEIIYVDFIYEPVKGQDGIVDKIMVVVAEVTAKVKACKKSEQSEAQLKSIIAAAPVAIGVFTGRELKIEMLNQTFVDIVGKGNGIIGKPLAEVMPEPEGQPFLQILDDIYTSGKIFQTFGTQKSIVQNGVMTQGFYDFSYTPLFDTDGKVYAILEIAVDVTDMVLDRRRIEKSEQQVRSLVESAPFPISVYSGKEMRIELANQAIINVWGKGSAVTGKLFSDVLPKRDNQEIFEQLENVYNSGISFNAKNQRVNVVVDDKLKSYYFNFCFLPLLDPLGKVYGIMNTAADVTDLNKAMKTAEESERNLRNIIRHSPVAMCILRDADYVVEIANDRMIELWGKPAEAILNRPIFEALPEAKDQGLEVLLEMVLMKGETIEAHERPLNLMREDKIQEIFVNFVYQPLNDVRGSISGIMAVAIEVTDQVVARKKIEESESYFRNLTDSAPAMIWMTDPAGHCNYLNKQWYDYTGQSQQEAEGFGWLDATHQNDKEEVGKAFIDANEERKTFTALYRLRHRSGEYRWAIDTGSPRFSDTGDYEGMIGTVVDVHEENQAEEMLRYRKALLEAHIDASLDGILLVDVTGKIISYNQRFIEIWNMPQEIVNAKNDNAALSFAMTQLVHPQQFIEKVEYLYGHPDETSIDELEYKDGKIVQRHGYPVIGEDGTYYAWSWVFRDITPQKINENFIKQSEARFQAAVEAVAGILWTNNAQGEMEGEQPGWSALTGQSFEEYHGYGWAAAIHPDDAQPTIDAWNEAVRKQNTFVFEHRLKMKNGDWGHFSVQAIPVFNFDGTIREWVGVHTNITEQRRNQDILKESEERFRLLADEMPQFVWVGNSIGELEYFNKAVYDYSGLQEEDFVNGGWVQIVHPDDREENLRLWQHAVATGEHFNFEHRFRNKLGEYRWQLSRAVPQKDFNGVIQQWIGTSTDINDRKIFIEELENMVAERTKELNELNARLLQSNEDLQQFAHVASHDLKEPVRKIKLFAGRLQDEVQHFVKKDDAGLYLAKIQSAANRMIAMIEGVLAYSTLNDAEQLIEKIDINELLHHIETDLEVAIQQKNAIINCDNLPTIEGATVLIYQLFYNLVNNSLKFAKPGERVHIEITSKSVMKEGITYAEIKVTDKGIGFEQEYAEKIFDTFARLNSKDKFEGTGLGLSLCKKIIQRHRGTITALGTHHAGATFIVTIPYSQPGNTIK